MHCFGTLTDEPSENQFRKLLPVLVERVMPMVAKPR